MNPFWGSFFDHLKDRGRNAALFVVALGGLFVLLIVTAWAVENGHDDSIIAALSAAGLFFAIFAGGAIRRMFLNRRDRLKFPKLSSDELRKARSKLVNNPGTAPAAGVPSRKSSGFAG